MKIDTANQKIEVGIVTFMFGANFGCSLQRYAMQKVLKLRFGLNSQLINYVPNEEYVTRSYRCEKLRFKNWFNRKTYVDLIPAAWNHRPERFAEFDRTFTKRTQKFSSESELANSAETFSVFLTGSDQVWNPWACLNGEGYRFFMLGFAPEGTKIAYAPSLGVSEVNAEFEDAAQKYLPSFNWLSIRENDGSEILERILNRKIDVVLDPALLLSSEEWESVSAAAKPLAVQKKLYILCYALANLDPIIQMALKSGKSLGNPDIAVLCATPNEYFRVKCRFPYSAVKPILNAGPSEFVNLVKNAELVITDSFHGSVFAVIYQKPFWTMMRDKESAAKSMNSRITTLFTHLQLGSRLFEPETNFQYEKKDRGIDYKRVNLLLDSLKQDSICRLGKALTSVLNRK